MQQQKLLNKLKTVAAASGLTSFIKAPAISISLVPAKAECQQWCLTAFGLASSKETKLIQRLTIADVSRHLSRRAGRQIKAIETDNWGKWRQREREAQYFRCGWQWCCNNWQSWKRSASESCQRVTSTAAAFLRPNVPTKIAKHPSNQQQRRRLVTETFNWI